MAAHVYTRAVTLGAPRFPGTVLATGSPFQVAGPDVDHAGLRDGQVIAWLDRELAAAGEGTAIIWPQIPHVDRERFTRELLDGARAVGWEGTDQGSSTGWFSLRPKHGGRASKYGTSHIHIGIAPWIDQRRFPLADLNDPELARLLAIFHYETGVAWRMTAGTTGSAMIRNRYDHGRDRVSGYPQGQPVWRYDDAPEDPIGCAWELRWQRTLTAAERQMRYVHHFDITSQYMASAALSPLPVGRLGHVVEDQPISGVFEHVNPGYYLIDTPDTSAYPFPLLPIRDDGESLWVTSNTVDLLGSVGIPITIREMWTAPSHRVLRGWADQIRDLRFGVNPTTRRMQEARGAVPAWLMPSLKALTNRTIGIMARPGGRIYRPDWRDLIVDRARANFTRKLIKALPTAVPIRMNVDSVWYASDAAQPHILYAALEGAQLQPGKLRWVKTMTVADYLTAYPATHQEADPYDGM